MCQDCGCSVNARDVHVHHHEGTVSTRPAAGASIEVLHGILRENDHEAAHNRAHLQEHGVLAVNLMSSPGSGKTSLLEATIGLMAGKHRIAVIEGDLETENDAARIRARGVPAVQITTGSACHLDAHLVHRALHDLPLHDIDLLFIENVGNLVCPAGFDLGQHRNVTLLCVTEGDDKPAKYPVMFRAADLVALSKTDLLGVLDDFDPVRAEAALRALGRDTPMINTAARRAPDLKPWLDWLRGELERHRAQRDNAAAQRAVTPGEGTASPSAAHAAGT